MKFSIRTERLGNPHKYCAKGGPSRKALITSIFLARLIGMDRERLAAIVQYVLYIFRADQFLALQD